MELAEVLELLDHVALGGRRRGSGRRRRGRRGLLLVGLLALGRDLRTALGVLLGLAPLDAAAGRGR